MRKQWAKPELVVLVKGTSAEAVLVVCKGGGNWPIHPYDGNYNGCVLGPKDKYVACSMCNQYNTS